MQRQRMNWREVHKNWGRLDSKSELCYRPPIRREVIEGIDSVIMTDSDDRRQYVAHPDTGLCFEVPGILPVAYHQLDQGSGDSAALSLLLFTRILNRRVAELH